jgi:hypothetical protein
MDPFTIMALTSAATGGIQALGNIKAKREAEAAQQESQDAFDALMRDYESGKFDAQVAQSERDLAQMTKTLAEESTQSAVERGREALSAVTAGLRGGDPRSAANISSVLKTVGDQQQQSELAGLQAQVGAEGRLAGLETEAQRRNEALATQMFQYGLDRSAAGIEAARQQYNDARNKQLGGLASGVQGIGQAALYKGIYGGNNKNVTQNIGAGATGTSASSVNTGTQNTQVSNPVQSTTQIGPNILSQMTPQQLANYNQALQQSQLQAAIGGPAMQAALLNLGP